MKPAYPGVSVGAAGGIALLVLLTIQVASKVSLRTHRAQSQAATRQVQSWLPSGFIEPSQTMDPRVAFQSLGGGTSTFVLKSGELVHSIDLGPTERGHSWRHTWVLVERAIGSKATPHFRGVQMAVSSIYQTRRR